MVLSGFRYRQFLEDPKNVAWIVGAAILGTVTLVTTVAIIAKGIASGPSICKKKPKRMR